MMRRSPKTLVFLLLLVALVLVGAATLAAAASPAGSQAASVAVEPLPAEPPAIVAGNYCVSCHNPDDARLNNPTAWRGEIAAAGVTPCPAMKQIHEEVYYTERLLLSIDRYAAALPAFVDTSSLDGKLAAGQQGYLRLLDTPVNSLDAFTAEAQAVRFKLGKIYTSLQALDEAAKRTQALMVGLGVTLFVLGSLAWGWYNTRMAKSPAGKPRWGSLARIGVFLLLVAAFFSLPLLRLPPQVDAASEPEAQAVQTELDTAQRAGDAADRAMARAWMIGKIGARWHEANSEKGAEVFEAALEAAQEAQTETLALWGEAAAAQEAAVSDPTAMEQAGLIAGQIQASRSRTWNYRLMAENWADQAAPLLEAALSATEKSEGTYRDLDRRAIAVAWANIDLQQALNILQTVKDPAVRSWGLREVASATGSAAIYNQALEAAQLVEYPTTKAYSLGEIAFLTKDAALAKELVTVLDGTDAADRAYGLASLAGLTGSTEAAELIDPAFPAAQALAQLRIGRFSEAWEASLKISDPFERARAQSEIASQLAQSDPQKAAEMAGMIETSLLRDRTMRNVIQITGDASLVDSIENPYDRVLALTSLGRYDEAEGLAGELKETYPLVRLAVALAEDDPQRSLALVDKLQREADKAVVLMAVAQQTRDPQIFERALAMAAAARVRGDALAPTQATLDLAIQFMEINPALAEKALAQALDLAKRISIK